MDEDFVTTRPLLPGWTSTPIPNLSLSAGGLLALADLTTVAQRTVIAGGSSWLDALVLAPGLHYQQAAHALHDHPRAPDAHPGHGVRTAVDGGTQARHVVHNTALVGYLGQLWEDADDTGTLTLDVDELRDGAGREDMKRLGRGLSGFVRRRPTTVQQQQMLGEMAMEMDWLSHLFYLASPLLTAGAVTVMVLLADWWGLTFILALMASRILNIVSIKQRVRPKPLDPQSRPAAAAAQLDRHTEYEIDLGNGRRAVLRGLNSDLQAVTAHTWLRGKTCLDGFLEATAKLLVYLVAAFSGNLTQAGAIVLMTLLLISAGLLGMSNAHAKGLQMNGRRARLQILKALRESRGREDVQAGGESGAPDG